MLGVTVAEIASSLVKHILLFHSFLDITRHIVRYYISQSPLYLDTTMILNFTSGICT